MSLKGKKLVFLEEAKVSSLIDFSIAMRKKNMITINRTCHLLNINLVEEVKKIKEEGIHQRKIKQCEKAVEYYEESYTLLSISDCCIIAGVPYEFFKEFYIPLIV